MLKFLIFFISLNIFYLNPIKTEPIDLNSENFDKYILETELFVIMFYADNCSFSKEFMPIFYEVDVMLREEIPDSKKFLFGRINCYMEISLAKRFYVDKTPTIHFFYKGENLYDEYRKRTDSTSFLEYIKNEIELINNSVKEYKSYIELGNILDSSKSQIIAYFKNRYDYEYQIFKSMSLYFMKKCDFFVGFDNALEPTHPLVKASMLFRSKTIDIDENEQIYKGNLTNIWNIYNWISMKCDLPIIETLHSEYDARIENRKPTFVFISKNSRTENEYTDIIYKEFRNIKDEFNFFYCKKKSICHAVLIYYKKDDSKLPIILLDTMWQLYIYNNFKSYKKGDLLNLYYNIINNQTLPKNIDGPYNSIFQKFAKSNSEKFTYLKYNDAEDDIE